MKWLVGGVDQSRIRDVQQGSATDLEVDVAQLLVAAGGSYASKSADVAVARANRQHSRGSLEGAAGRGRGRGTSTSALPSSGGSRAEQSNNRVLRPVEVCLILVSFRYCR